MKHPSSTKAETFPLPNGEVIEGSDSHHAKYAHMFTQLGSDVMGGLNRVFASEHSLSREDIEHALRLHTASGQKKILRGYFFRFSDMSKEKMEAIYRAIETFPTKNWTNADWGVFGNLAPQPVTKEKKILQKSSTTKKPRYTSSFALLQQDYTGKGLPRDWKGDKRY